MHQEFLSRQMMPQPPHKNVRVPQQSERDGYKAVKILSAMFALIAGICFISGIILANKHYDFDWVSFFGGIIAAMFNLGWAVVMRVCALYMKEHDK